MKGKWRVTYNGSYYEVYRLRDIARVDHSGNREYAKPIFQTKDRALAYAAGANDQKEITESVAQTYIRGMSTENLERKTDTDKDLESYHKAETLGYFEKALKASGRDFTLILSRDDSTVEVIDETNGARRTVNIACDNAAAMMLDILKQAGDWIL